MITKKEWLELHTLCFDTIRSAIASLPDERFELEPSCGGRSIGEEVDHIIGLEAYWLDEVGIKAAFRWQRTDACSESYFTSELEKIELQYRGILDEKGLERNILFGLGRVCQHALHHWAIIVRLRRTFEPDWEHTPWPETGSCGRAVDFIAEMLILGTEAKP